MVIYYIQALLVIFIIGSLQEVASMDNIQLEIDEEISPTKNTLINNPNNLSQSISLTKDIQVLLPAHMEHVDDKHKISYPSIAFTGDAEFLPQKTTFTGYTKITFQNLYLKSGKQISFPSIICTGNIEILDPPDVNKDYKSIDKIPYNV